VSDLINRLHTIVGDSQNSLLEYDRDTIREAISELGVKYARDCRSEYYMKLSKLADEAEAIANRATDLSV
jgi:hypothetical protein